MNALNLNLSRRDTLGFMVLALAIIVGLTVRIVGALDKKTIEHDEAQSILAATGHLGTYYLNEIYGSDQSLKERWVQASHWKNLLQLDNKLCLGQIRRDIAAHDVHPPFYYWLLHLWFLWFGVNSLAGLSLNFVIFLLTVFTLFRLGQFVFGNILEASLGTLFWALSPATIVTSLVARNWELLSFLTVLFALLTMKYVDGQDKARNLDLLSLAIVACVGSLTHYQFLLIVLPAGVLLGILKMATNNWQRLLPFLASIFFGCLLAFFLHPDFTSSFRIHQGFAKEPFTFNGLAFRMLAELACLASFFTAILQRITDGGLLLDPTRAAPMNFQGIISVVSWVDLLVILVVALVLFAIAWSFYANWTSREIYGRIRSVWKSPTGTALWFGTFFVGSITAEYLTFVLPVEAMRERYLSMFWPFAAISLVLVIRHTGKRDFFSILFVGLFLFAGVNQALHLHWYNKKLGDPGPLFEKVPSLVVDTLVAGKLFPVLWHVPDSTMVFVASQNYLLEHEKQWLEGIRDGGTIVSVLGYGARKEHQEQIARMATEKCRISDLDVPTWRWTKLFKIESCHR